MGLIWYLLIFLALGAVCSIAMILISDRLQHRKMRITSIRTQDILQYQLDKLTAQNTLSGPKPVHAMSPSEERHPHDQARGPKPEPVGGRPEARYL